MRRVAATAALALALLAPGAEALAGPKLPASVRVAECSVDDQSAVFRARMGSMPRTARMSVRLTLLVRGADGTFRPVAAPGLDRWRHSKRGVRGFGFRQRVQNLAAGADYRARVDFRWHSKSGKVLRRARRRSRTCSQVRELPNLRAGALQVWRPRNVPSNVARYRLSVLNPSRGFASSFAVTLSVDGAALDTVIVPRLEPREVRYVSFTGPACERQNSPVVAVVDAGTAVRETNETDNRLSGPCGSFPGRSR